MSGSKPVPWVEPNISQADMEKFAQEELDALVSKFEAKGLTAMAVLTIRSGPTSAFSKASVHVPLKIVTNREHCVEVLRRLLERYVTGRLKQQVAGQGDILGLVRSFSQARVDKPN